MAILYAETLGTMEVNLISGDDFRQAQVPLCDPIRRLSRAEGAHPLPSWQESITGCGSCGHGRVGGKNLGRKCASSAVQFFHHC